MIRVWLARTPARLIEKVKMTHFFEAKVCPNGPKWTFWDGAGPGSRPKCQNDTLFWTKSVSVLIEIKGIGPKTYSNSYKKLMILRESNPIEQNRGENDRNSWNPVKMINPTHFFLKKCVGLMESSDFLLPGRCNGRFGLDSAGLDCSLTEQQSGSWTALNWTELD